MWRLTAKEAGSSASRALRHKPMTPARPSQDLLAIERSALVVIDVQQRYLPHLHRPTRLVEAVRRLCRGAGIAGVPVVVTEQYPQGLGPTTDAVREALPAGTLFCTKLSMSCLGSPEFRAWLDSSGRDQIVLAGIEGHACVAQTALELLAAGRQVRLVLDAITTRYPFDGEVAVQRLCEAGAVPATVEAVLLEWARTAESPLFQPLRALIRDPLPDD